MSLAFYRRNKKTSYSCIVECYDKCEKHSAVPLASLCTSLVFLKIPACLYNSTMHSDAFFYFLTKARVSKDRAEGGGRRAEGGGPRAEGARVFFYQEKMRGQRGTLRALAGICRFH